MGKKLVMGALLALIFAAALIEYLYVAGAEQRLGDALTRVEEALRDGDSGDARQAARGFSAQWATEKQRLEALFEHDEIDVISAMTRRIEVYCGEDDAVNALAEVTAAQFHVSHLREMTSVRWENIF